MKGVVGYLNYFWVRIFDYRKENEDKFYEENDTWEKYKGVLLDEYYLCGEDMERKQAKILVTKRSSVKKFAKPRKNNGIYALVMDSNKFFYDRFNIEIDTICFNCHKPIKGKLKDFPNMEQNGERYHFCSWDCKREVLQKVNPYNSEGEWQKRDGYEESGVYGYIYHIYNRKTNKHYVGQTVYMPFFRWQEHAKQHIKGDLVDLVFETITEVRVKSQKYLNDIEAWWIRKFISEYGRENVMNITVPKIAMEDLVCEYQRIVSGQIKIENRKEVEK